MRPEPQDRLVQDARPTGRSRTLLIACLVGIVAAALWFFNRAEPELAAPEAEAVSPAKPLAEPELALPAAADIPPPVPVPAPAPPMDTPNEPVIPAPPTEPPLTMANSDDELRERMAQVSSSPLLQKPLAQDNLVERGTAAVDALSRGGTLGKLLPLTPPKGDFSVVEIGDQVTIDPASYERYEMQVRMIESLDVALLDKSFHRFRPLLEQTYANMGYEAEDFDNALIRMLDRILAVPQIDGPIPVVKSEAIYKYADPALERRSALEKQLLRMGPENVARVQKQARALRSALLAAD